MIRTFKQFLRKYPGALLTPTAVQYYDLAQVAVAGPTSITRVTPVMPAADQKTQWTAANRPQVAA